MSIEIKPSELTEEYRVLHSTMELKLTWVDYLKLALGNRLNMSYCIRLVFTKDSAGKVVDINWDTFSTKTTLVTDGEEPEHTSEAIFDYDKLHKG